MKKEFVTKIISIFFLIGIVFFNAYLHSAELGIQSEVNDNIFQFALVDEAKTIWSNVLSGRQSVMYLFDSHNERWNEGFALSNYYAHLPQALLSFASIVSGIDTKTLFNVIKYLFLILLPVSFFISARVFGLSYVASLIAAFASHAIITDGLYGIDMTSFLWRGWGLSSQLFGLMFAPLALSFSYQYIVNKKYLVAAVLCNFLLAQNHMGIFFMVSISYPLIFFAVISTQNSSGESGLARLVSLFKSEHTQETARRLAYLALLVAIVLSYIFVPFFLQGQYRNFSLWDPIWKFDSFGLLQTAMWLVNGDLFDFGRLPIISYLTMFGFLYMFSQKKPLYRFLGISWILYLIFFIGRRPFGPIIDVIPGFSEFHVHRFIVAFQLVSVYIVALFCVDVVARIVAYIRVKFGKNALLAEKVGFIFACLVAVFMFYVVEKPLVAYSHTNKIWIAEANERYIKDERDYKKVLSYLSSAPIGRVYAGRPGNWGRDFTVGDTAIYMALSRDGIPGIAFAPESWSPNAEFDQFFNELDKHSYELFNVTHVVAPAFVEMPEFAKQAKQFGKYIIYETTPQSWFAFGSSSSVATGNKTDFVNITHLWMTTKGPKNGEYPEVSYRKNPNPFKKNDIVLHDKQTFTFRGKTRRLSEENPLYDGHDKQKVTVAKKSEKKTIAGYSATFDVSQDCEYCVVVLKQTFHPNWQVKVNGELVSAYPVFPFYIAVPVQKAGIYTIEAEYRPGSVKTLFLILSVIAPCVMVMSRVMRKTR